MKILLAVFAALVAVILGGLAWLGAFADLKVEERELGPYSYVYVQDPSADSGRVGALTDELGGRLEKAGYRTRQPAQVYFPQGRGIQNQIGFLVDRAVGNDVLGAETFFRPIPPQRYMQVRFPYRSPMSFTVGTARADALLREHRAAKKYAETFLMVIVDGDTIRFLQPIEPA